MVTPNQVVKEIALFKKQLGIYCGREQIGHSDIYTSTILNSFKKKNTDFLYK